MHVGTRQQGGVHISAQQHQQASKGDAQFHASTEDCLLPLQSQTELDFNLGDSSTNLEV